MSVFKRGDVYWYHFLFAGRHIQESTKTHSKTLAKVKPLYGHQQDATLGYNPAKPGRPSHAYHSSFIAPGFPVLHASCGHSPPAAPASAVLPLL
jgi:hypothetical protein